MGSSKKQVTGHKYYTSLVAMLGNRIEGLLGFNFDKKGWIQSAEVDENGLMKAGLHTLDKPQLFGETEGGINGTVAIYDGEESQSADTHYQQHYALASASPFLSYLVFRDFYVGNSPYLKEIQLWPKRIHVKNDSSPQWHDEKAEIPTILINPPEPSVEYKVSQSAWAGHYTAAATQAGSDYYLSATYTNTTVGQYVLEKTVTANKFTILKLILTTRGNLSDIKIDGVLKILSSSYSRNETEAGWDGEIELLLDIGTSEIKIKFNMDAGEYQEGTSFPLTRLVSVNSYHPIETDIIPPKYISGFDINPIHKIREILTDETAMNKPESDINDENFKTCADRIFNEKLGISWAITEKSCTDAISELCTHIEAGVRVNRQTGQYEIVLFRDDLLNIENALVFNESNIKNFQPEVANADEIINTLNVNYYDRENGKSSSFNVYENGLIRTVGHEQAETADFPYFMNKRNAEIVANWKLKQLSTPLWTGSFTTGFYEARKLNRYDVVLLNWASKNIVNLPVRVLKISLGDGRDNTVTIDFAEVVPYSSMMQSSINTDASNSQILPPQPTDSIIFEMPYFEAVQNFGEVEVKNQLENMPELGFAMVASKRPQNNSLNAQLQTTSGAGWEKTGVVHYCPNCVVTENIGFIQDSFIVSNIQDFSELTDDTIGQINDELIAFVSFDVLTNRLTVKRAILDSMPIQHAKNSVIYWWDSDSGIDSTQYIQHEVINAKVITTTPSAVLDFNDAELLTLEMNARAIRPYPPANIKINNIYYPETALVSNDLLISWVDRNRLQQTGGAVLSWFDSSVTIEENTSYSLELSSENNILHSAQDIQSQNHSIPASVLIPNKLHKLKLWSVRDGFDSYHFFEHSLFVESASLILTATTSKENVTGNTLPTANISVNIDESLSANMNFDGKKILGKAEAGSTITIEIED